MPFSRAASRTVLPGSTGNVTPFIRIVIFCIKTSFVSVFLFFFLSGYRESNPNYKFRGILFPQDKDVLRGYPQKVKQFTFRPPALNSFLAFIPSRAAGNRTRSTSTPWTRTTSILQPENISNRSKIPAIRQCSWFSKNNGYSPRGKPRTPYNPPFVGLSCSAARRGVSDPILPALRSETKTSFRFTHSAW